MDIVSIVFLVIMLIFAIIGIVKGFINSIISFAGGLIAIALAAVLAKPLSQLFINLDFVVGVENSIYDWLVSLNPAFEMTFYNNDKTAIMTVLSDLNLPEFLNSIIADNIITLIPDEGIYLGEVVSHSLTEMLLIIIIFILLFIIIKLILFILKKSIKKILDAVKLLKAVDKLAGAVLGALIGLIIVDVICIGITAMNGVPFLEDISLFINEQMCLGTDQMTIAKFIYENNIVLMIIALIF